MSDKKELAIIFVVILALMFVANIVLNLV